MHVKSLKNEKVPKKSLSNVCVSNYAHGYYFIHDRNGRKQTKDPKWIFSDIDWHKYNKTVIFLFFHSCDLTKVCFPVFIHRCVASCWKRSSASRIDKHEYRKLSEHTSISATKEKVNDTREITYFTIDFGHVLFYRTSRVIRRILLYQRIIVCEFAGLLASKN